MPWYVGQWGVGVIDGVYGKEYNEGGVVKGVWSKGCGQGDVGKIWARPATDKEFQNTFSPPHQSLISRWHTRRLDAAGAQAFGPNSVLTIRLGTMVVRAKLVVSTSVYHGDQIPKKIKCAHVSPVSRDLWNQTQSQRWTLHWYVESAMFVLKRTFEEGIDQNDVVARTSISMVGPRDSSNAVVSL